MTLGFFHSANAAHLLQAMLGPVTQSCLAPVWSGSTLVALASAVGTCLEESWQGAGSLRKETHLPSENEMSCMFTKAENEEDRLGSESCLHTTEGMWAVQRK